MGGGRGFPYNERRPTKCKVTELDRVIHPRWDGSNNTVVFRKAEFLHDWYDRIYLIDTSKYQAHGLRHLQNRCHGM